MSVWSSFLDNIAKPAGRLFQSSVDTVSGIVAGNLGSPSQAIANIAIDAGVDIGASKMLAVNGLNDRTAQAVKENLKYSAKQQASSNDLVLQAGVKVHDKVISPYITRPISTLALVTDSTSPLYQPGQFEEGFQVSDIKEAYNRSAQVSLGQALTKSDLTPISLIADVAFNAGGIDLDKVDLWDDNDIQRAYVDNTVGKYFTGVVDFTASNVAISGAFGVMAKAGNLAARGVGLSSKGTTLATMESRINDTILNTQTQGIRGTRNTVGDDVERLAATQNVNEVLEIATKYTNNDKLLGPLQRATDPNTVRDLILADKGYLPALDRLSKNAPADLFEIADMNSSLRATFIETGKLPDFDENGWARMNAAFDDAINRVPEYRTLRDALLDPETKIPYSYGKDYMPAEPKIFKDQFIAGRKKIRDIKVAAVTGSIDERILGNSIYGPITRVVRFVGTQLPIGWVTNSGSRAFDGITELNAFFDDIDIFKDGNKMLTVGSSKIKAADIRDGIISDYVQAKTSLERQLVLKSVDEKLGITIANTYGFFDTAKIMQFISELQNQVNGSTSSIARKGYAMDAQGQRVITDVQTQGQLMEAYRLAPWNLFEKELLIAIKKSKAEIGAVRTSDTIKAVYEGFNKYWTLDVLARPSYIPKNSLFEPALSATLAHGINVVVDGVPTMTKRFIQNNTNRIKNKAAKVYKGPEYKAVNQAIDDLTTQLDKAVSQLDAYVSEAALFAEPNRLSPKTIQENQERVMSAMKRAEKLVDDIELELRDAVRPFGTMSQVPTIAGLERRVNFLESLSGKTTNKVKLFPKIKDYIDGGTGGLPETRSVVGFVNSQYLAKMPGNPVDTELVNSYRKIFTSKELKQPLMVVYDNETGFAYLGEGNHRLQAALAENIPYLPVRVTRGNASEMQDRIENGRPVLQVKNNKILPFTTGGPRGPVEYMPPLVHPSFIFDKKFLVEEDAFSQTSLTARYGADIANAKSAIGAAKGAINTLAPNPAELLAANKNIAMQYQVVDEILDSLGPARKAQAETYLKSADYAKRYYGKEENYRMIQGQWVPIKSLFDENQFGAAFREEFGNSRTVAATYLSELNVGVRQGMILRRGPSTVTYVNDPQYFAELAYYVNRALRNDPLIKQILAETSEANLIKWSSTDAGQAYFNQFGTVTPGVIPDLIRDRVGLVNRYIPNVEAKALILTKDVNAFELQSILSDDLKRLSPIHPLDFNAHQASEFGVRTLGQVEQAINRGANWIFGKLTAPENPIRWYSADRFFADNLARKANELSQQGLTFVRPDGTANLERLNSLRSSARREALVQNEQTFYTIRRQNKFLYSARLATAFPTASLNAFYRYGRFALKNPERVGQFLYNYQSAFRSFGVDEYGEPTDDPLKATHLVVPTTEELGFFGGKGIRLNARSIGFLLNYPTPSIYGSIALNKIYQAQPEAEDTMKQLLGSYYDVVFPYGPTTSIARSLTPTWANDLYNYLSGPEGKKDFVDSWKDVHNYYMVLDEMGIAKYPGEKVVNKVTRDLYGVKSSWSFASMFGVPAKVDTRPMQIFEDLYGSLVNKYVARGETFTTAKELAGAEMLVKVGPNFPLDRITFKGSTANTYIQPTAEGYNRVFKDNEKLVKTLANQNLELVGLLTLDIDPTKEDFNLTVYRMLQDPNTKINGQLLNEIMITPQEEEKRRGVNRAWALYNQVTESLEKVALDRDGKSLRSHQDLLQARQDIAGKQIRGESEAWWTEYNDAVRGDKSFRYAYGLNTIVNDKEFMAKHGKTKLWDDVSDFLAIRNAVVSVYQDMPDRSPMKSAIKRNYLGFIETQMKTWHPKLQELIKRNFIEDTMKDATKEEAK
jgi:hypothetical protein